jgi:hypothetical protein
VALGINAASSTMSYGYGSAGRLTSLTRDLNGPDRDQLLGFTCNGAPLISRVRNLDVATAWRTR